MISRLTGFIIEKNPPFIVVDVHGIGFEIEVSMQTFYQLPEINQQVSLYIHAHYREDSQQLFGFDTPNEKETFRQLIKVNGIGVKTALAILSVLDINELTLAVKNKNASRLSSVPGIGKKTAERLILELTDKLPISELDNTISQIAHDNTEDIIQTLLALGYNQKEAQNAIKNIAPELNLSDAVKLALKNLTK
ncbi:Holliday junction branch migration protein RuvA [Neisseriaceae bacterium PsAf]|nr:Holliday junction branch migration protein RuvA [Neisseriaceae bacterium PsAf]MCV2503366.1 Holliday junction branch migration protein RuvA [Neisseriaceae bacterium]